MTLHRLAAALCVCVAALAWVAPAQAQTVEPAKPEQPRALTIPPHTMLVAALIYKLKTIQQPGTTSVDATLETAAPIVGSVTNDVQGLASARKIVQTATGQNLGGSLSQTNIAVECAATAMTGAVATHVKACYLKSASGATYHVPDSGAKPGAADARAGGSLLVPNRTYSVCVQSQGLFQDGTYLLTPTVCSGGSL